MVTTANELSRFFEIFRRGGELDGVRVMEPETLRRALEEQSRLEIDLSLIFPTRFSYGLMLGADVISLYGRDTDLAFGHLGLINIMGWTDPERGISGGLITSGKAIVYPEVHRFYGLMQRIASSVPKVPPNERPFSRSVGSAAMAIKGEAVIRRAYTAFGERDLETLVDLSDSEGSRSRRSPVCSPGARSRTGGTRDSPSTWSDLGATWKRLELQPQHFHAVGDGRVLVFGRVRAWHGHGFLDSSNAWLWTLRDDLVLEVRVYADPADARRAFADEAS